MRQHRPTTNLMDDDMVRMIILWRHWGLEEISTKMPPAEPRGEQEKLTRSTLNLRWITTYAYNGLFHKQAVSGFQDSLIYLHNIIYCLNVPRTNTLTNSVINYLT